VGAISGQHVAIGLLDRLHGQLVRHQFRLALRPGRPEVSLAEHLAILEAVADRRPDDANLAVRAHLASVIEALQACDQPDQQAGAASDHDISRYVESRPPDLPATGQPTG
jgi:DNA-binding FadR family transcriptional regulator